MQAPRNADPERVAALLRLVDDVLAAHLGPERGAAAAAELRERAGAFGDHLLGGVNPAREDASATWDQARAAAYAPTERTGAVHLELGTFTAFGDARVEELVAGDGLSEFIRLDADPQYPCDVVADATAMPFGSGTIDRVASNSVLEHIAYPHEVLRETHRVLRPGGVMVVVMPFVWHQHGYPNDYVRLTPGFFERVCPEVGFTGVEVDVDTSGGLYNVLHNAAKMAGVEDGRPETAAMRELHELVITLLGTLIPLDRHFTEGGRYWFHSVRVLARKPGTFVPQGRPRQAGRPFAERALDLLADPETKTPLRREGSRLVAPFTGVSYPVGRDGAVNFLEPRAARPPVGSRVKAAARRVLR
jgi:SAM-dependent methyltransferase